MMISRFNCQLIFLFCQLIFQYCQPAHADSLRINLASIATSAQSAKLVCNTPGSRFAQCLPTKNPVINATIDNQLIYFKLSDIQRIVFPSDSRCPVDSLQCDLYLDNAVISKLSIANIAKVPNKNTVKFAATAVNADAIAKNQIDFVEKYNSIDYASYSAYYQDWYVTIVSNQRREHKK